MAIINKELGWIELNYFLQVNCDIYKTLWTVFGLTVK